MTNPYTAPTISGYNSSPPSDDGANTSANEITWSKHKDKIGDPLKNYADAISSAITTAFGKNFLNSISTQSTNYTILAGDRGKLIDCSNTITITLLAAGTAGSGFAIAIRNAGSGVITVDGDGTETINGALTQTLGIGEWIILDCDGTNWSATLGSNFGGRWVKGTDVASAATLTLGTDGNYFDITGTTAITSITTRGITGAIKLHFDAALTLTHHATDLILPGGSNITTAAGDEAEFIEYASGDWRCTNYQQAATPPDDKIVPYSGANRAATLDDATGEGNGIVLTNTLNVVEIAVDLTATTNLAFSWGASSQVTLSAGFYHLYNHTTTVSLQVQINSTWYDMTGFGSGSTWVASIWSDGTNVRLNNTGGSPVSNLHYNFVATNP